jgi:hypothetical protein
LGTTSVAAPKAASSSTAIYFFNRPAGHFRWQPILALIPFCRLASALIRLASIAKASPLDQSLADAALQERLEDAPQQIALAEAAIPVLREGRLARADLRLGEGVTASAIYDREYVMILVNHNHR